VASVLFVGVERLLADALRRKVQGYFPDATTTVTSELADARAVLAASPVDLLVVVPDRMHGDALGFIAAHTRNHRCATFAIVVTDRHDPHTVATLNQLVVDGVVDLCHADLGEFIEAVKAVPGGLRFTSRSWLERSRQRLEQAALLRALTPADRLVLGIIGDG
jgi:DNA-binding NarL/FixJ family response regulator